jgi:phosphoribosylformylglycinamidine cyclo-ligase
VSAADPAGATYAGAGVDIAAGDEAVARIRSTVDATRRPGVLGGVGGFGGLFSLGALGAGRLRDPVLVSTTDGIGTKLLVAKATGRYGTVGIDLVAMCVDDLVCTGAEPLFLLDYLAVGTLDPARVADVVAGIAEGCRQAGCARLGGETAEHPGAMAPDDLDVAGFAVGIVERDHLLDPASVRPGDALVGLASPGLRSNGYSLARHVLLDRAGLDLDGPAWPGSPHSLADELLRPAIIYAPAVLGALAAAPGGVRAAAHITGGGLPGNLARALPPHCDGVLRRSRWEVPPIFDEIARLGPVADDEMARVFNLGLGMVLVVSDDASAAVVDALEGAGVVAQVVGDVVAGTGRVVLS